MKQFLHRIQDNMYALLGKNAQITKRSVPVKIDMKAFVPFEAKMESNYAPAAGKPKQYGLLFNKYGGNILTRFAGIKKHIQITVTAWKNSVDVCIAYYNQIVTSTGTLFNLKAIDGMQAGQGLCLIVDQHATTKAQIFSQKTFPGTCKIRV